MVNYSDFTSNFEQVKLPLLSSVYFRSKNYIKASNSIFSDFKIPVYIQRFSPYTYVPQLKFSSTDSQFIGSFQLDATGRRPNYWSVQTNLSSVYFRRYILFVLFKNYWIGNRVFRQINKSNIFFDFEYKNKDFFPGSFEKKFITPFVNKEVILRSTIFWFKRNAWRRKDLSSWPFFKFFAFSFQANQSMAKRNFEKTGKISGKTTNIHGYFGPHAAFSKVYKTEEAVRDFSRCLFSKKFRKLKKYLPFKTLVSDKYKFKTSTYIWLFRFYFRFKKLFSEVDPFVLFGKFTKFNVSFNKRFSKSFRKYIFLYTRLFKKLLYIKGRNQNNRFFFLPGLNKKNYKFYSFFYFFYNTKYTRRFISHSFKISIQNFPQFIGVFKISNIFNKLKYFNFFIFQYVRSIFGNNLNFRIIRFRNKFFIKGLKLRRFPWYPKYRFKKLQLLNSYRYFKDLVKIKKKKERFT